ncbi:MAG: sensor histidine kinase [Clostridiaceae bacterium]|nr:sensor histidine kinase [Clostridiaceae bacterium]
MLDDKVFLLFSSDVSGYDSFIGFLNCKFNNVTVLSNINLFADNLEGLPSDSCAETSLTLIFVEYPLLDDAAAILKRNMNSHNYVLTVFYSGSIGTLGSRDNVFDFINTSGFDEDFFFSRLWNEIANRKKICSLNYEVKKFYEIGMSLSYEKDTVKLLDMIISSSMNLTSSDAGTIYLVIDRQTFNWTSVKNNNYEDKILKFVIAKNTSMNVDLETFTSPITRQSIFGYSVITGETLRIDNAYSLGKDLDYKHNNSFDIRTGYITKSILSIPMKDHEDNILGVIQLINKKKNKSEIIDYSNAEQLNNIIPYDFSDELIMNSLAGQAAVVLENNLLYRDMQGLLESYKKQNSELEMLSKKIMKAHEEERKRIARDIHDGPAQAVVNLSLKVELSKKYLQNAMYEKAVEEMETLNEAIKTTSKEIRTILYDLKPSYLEMGLLTALENRFRLFEDNTGIKVNFNASGDDSGIEFYLSSTIYKMVQESLTNIYKHAKAQSVNVSFSINESKLVIVVEDDGIGFDLDAAKAKNPSLKGGFGLGGLRERAEIIRGEVEIKSAPGNGTRITISIPL